ncbi:hypothetical protein JCM13580A_53560 [Streptomyces drozdowiczii]
MMGGRDVALVDAPVFLVGLYCAVSPWVSVAHFRYIGVSGHVVAGMRDV